MVNRFVILIIVLLVNSVFSKDRGIDIKIPISSIHSGKSVIFTGFQYKNPILSWDFDSEDNGKIFLDVDFVNGYLDQILNALPQNFVTQVPIINLTLKEQDTFKKLSSKIRSNYVGYPYRNVVLLDNETGDFLEEKIADEIGKNSDVYYYGTVVFEISHFILPNIINLYKEEFDVSVSFLIYNKAGKKAYVRTYTEHQKPEKGDIRKSPENRKIYIKAIIDLIEKHKKEIEKDISLWNFKNNKDEKSIKWNEFLENLKKK